MYFYLNSEKILTLKQLSDLLNISEKEIITFSENNNIEIEEIQEKELKNKNNLQLINDNYIKIVKKNAAKRIIEAFGDNELKKILFEKNKKISNIGERKKMKKLIVKKNYNEIMLLTYKNEKYICLSDLSSLAEVTQDSIYFHIKTKMKEVKKITSNNINNLDEKSIEYLKNNNIRIGEKIGSYILTLEEVNKIMKHIKIIGNTEFYTELKYLFDDNKLDCNKNKKMSFFNRLKKAFYILKG